MIEENKNKIAILVVSCDKYSDLHDIFFFFLKKFWQDCPYKIYLLTNNKNEKRQGVININIGHDISWSSNLKKSLEFIKEDFVFLWVDDLFLMEKVDSLYIESLFNWSISKNVNYLNLYSNPSPDRVFNKDVGFVLTGSIYRVSTVLSLWKKEILSRLLKEDESAWQFEINGSIRSDIFPNFFATNKEVIKTINAVVKGKWRRKSIRILNKFNIQPDLKVRPQNNIFEEFVFFMKIIRTRILMFMPRKYRIFLRQFLKFKKDE